MKLMYHTRICAALPGEEPVELARFVARRMLPADWRAHTADLSPEWDIWAEQPMRDNECISSRPRILHRSGSAKNRASLTHEQKQEAGIYFTP